MRKKKHTEPFLSNRQLSEKEFSELIETVNLLIDQSSKYFKRNKPKLAGKKGLKLTYQFKIKLRGISKPPVWRRILVPSHFTFSGLHAVIQVAFGWYNEHLYCFGDTAYSNVLNIAEAVEYDEPDYNARTFTIGEYFGDGTINRKLCYVYDFGDDWIHDIEIEKILNETSEYAKCTASKGISPEEDCGGVWSYNEMKEAGELVDDCFNIEDINYTLETVPPIGFDPIE